jgi:hypothetical protein
MPLHLRVGEKFIGPGRVEEITLGGEAGVPVKIVSGLTTGAKLFLVGGLRLGERLSPALAQEFIGALDPRHLHGVIFLVTRGTPSPPKKKSKAPPPVEDLGRSFPGKANGDPAEQLAQLIFREVVTKSDFGIELHAAPEGWMTLPHVQANLANAHVRRLCEAFGASVVLDDPGPPRSLRRVATEFGVPTLTYETGTSGRSEKTALQEGLKGINGILANLRMMGAEIPWRGAATIIQDPRWLEAKRSGRLDLLVQPGATLRAGETLARVEGTENIVAPGAVVVLAVNAARTVEAGTLVCQVASPVENNSHRNATPA